MIPLLFNDNFRKQLLVVLGKQNATDVIHKSKLDYREIVMRSPYIGGWNNPLFMHILIAAFAAAIYKAADGKLSVEQMGQVFSNAIEQTTAYKLFMKLMGKQAFTRRWQDKRNSASIESQKKIYPAGFVFEFVYGKTTNEYGINYRECGICKLLNRENCAEIATQMCNFDYVTAKYMNCELTRTKTIANGENICDFWFKKL